MNLFLIGYRGTGKSTVGRMLADRLGWDFVDSDEVITEQAGCTIAQIFAGEGEEAFRQRESVAVTALASRERTVVALGGGAVLREANRTALAGRGPVVWLTARCETLAERIQADQVTAAQRPSLTGLAPLEEIRQVLEQRKHVYQGCADLEVDTEEKTPAEVVEVILAKLADRLSP